MSGKIEAAHNAARILANLASSHLSKASRDECENAANEIYRVFGEPALPITSAGGNYFEVAAPVVERQPVAWLVTDIHGQKKALRAGAEGIERHRNSGSTLVPLFDYPPSQAVADDGWYTDECGNLRYKPEESPPAPVAVVLPERIQSMVGLETSYARGWNACLDKVKEMNQ